MFWKNRSLIILIFAIASSISAYYVTQLKFSFNFSQFFPEGDEDLEYFKNFRAEFESDDNFLLIAIENDKTVFRKEFLKKFHEFTLQARGLPHVISSQSLTTISYPVKTPFGITAIPVIHIENPELYKSDSIRLMEDTRFTNNLINSSATAMVVNLKTKDEISITEAEELIDDLRELLRNSEFKDFHILGRAYFQCELVRNQKKEILISGIVSVLLVSFIMMLLYRKWIGVAIALFSIGIALLIFMGILGLLGRELSVMSALYPVLMLIVGTSDVIHIMTRYLDELYHGVDKRIAMRKTIKEIGLATLMTSLTTAVGFASLLSSRLAPVRDFGINAALGVIIAFITVIFLTTTLLSYFEKEQISRPFTGESMWDTLIEKVYRLTLTKPKWIIWGSIFSLAVCMYGLSKVTTNYRLEDNLPRKQKVTEDFKYFEQQFAGFRPLEFAISSKNGGAINTFKSMSEVNKLEEYLINSGNINSSISMATVYKSLERMSKGNTLKAYKFPETEQDFNRHKTLLERVGNGETTVLLNKSGDKTRVSTRIADIGADNIKTFGLQIEEWIKNNIDTNLISVRQTGTGLIVDKNAIYVTESLLYGLGIAIIIISLLLALILKDIRMLFIALIPNLIPLIFAGALLGYLGIELEAGISIVFAVVFGIAVDDTIHFLSRYKISRNEGRSVEKSLEITFNETGKAIVFTTIILFFGFLIMLFSDSPATNTVGLLISITLASALVCDLVLLPVVMRKVLKD